MTYLVAALLALCSVVYHFDPELSYWVFFEGAMGLVLLHAAARFYLDIRIEIDTARMMAAIEEVDEYD